MAVHVEKEFSSVEEGAFMQRVRFTQGYGGDNTILKKISAPIEFSLQNFY